VGAFQSCGIDASYAPSTPETVSWGRKFTSSKGVLPLYMTTGDIPGRQKPGF